MKNCTNKDCTQVNPQNVKQFSRHSKNKDGLSTWCKQCHGRQNKLWQQNNREKANLHAKAHYERNKENVNNRCKTYYKENLEKVKNTKLLKSFGITLEQYLLMSHVQNNVCAICKKPESAKDARSGKIRDLAVDHCHTTGKVRGLLCGKCNQLIGLSNDNTDTLKQAASYLATAKS